MFTFSGTYNSTTQNWFGVFRQGRGGGAVCFCFYYYKWDFFPPITFFTWMDYWRIWFFTLILLAQLSWTAAESNICGHILLLFYVNNCQPHWPPFRIDAVSASGLAGSKSRVGRLTNWATQGPPISLNGILSFLPVCPFSPLHWHSQFFFCFSISPFLLCSTLLPYIPAVCATVRLSGIWSKTFKLL